VCSRAKVLVSLEGCWRDQPCGDAVSLLLSGSAGVGAMMSSMADPYYDAQQEVQEAVRKVQGMHEEWKRLLNSTNTAQSSKFQDLHAEIAGELRALDNDLGDITATIDMIESNRAKFQQSDAEIAKRKDFVKSSRAVVKEVQDSVTSRQAQQKMDNDKRQVAASKRQSQESENRAARENDAFLDRQRQEQAQIMASQDEALQAISDSAQRLGNVARTINVELQEQQVMLNQLDEDIDRETEKLNFVMKRIGRLLKTSDSKQLCVIIALFVLFLVLLFLIINT